MKDNIKHYSYKDGLLPEPIDWTRVDYCINTEELTFEQAMEKYSMVCGYCEPLSVGVYLGTTCKYCHRPFRNVKTASKLTTKK